MKYDLAFAIDEVIRAGKELLDSGRIARTWGNISARVSDTQFVITPSGKAYDSLTADDIVLVDALDCSYCGDVKPSSEKGVHAAAYLLRPEIDFVIHTHQDYATAISILGREYKVKMSDPAFAEILGPYVPTAEYALSSTKALENHLAFCMDGYPMSRAILMRNHGTLCMGKDYDDAFDVAHRLEEVCKMKFKQLVGLDYPYEATEEKPLSSYAKVLRREIHEEYDRRHAIFEKKNFDCLIETDAPFIVKMSTLGRDMRVYVDDLAQMVGTSVACLPADASDEMIARHLTEPTGAVLIEGQGAIVAASCADDAEAVMMVLDKGCMAALLAYAVGKGDPVGKIGGALEHAVYTRKYSKLKDEEE